MTSKKNRNWCFTINNPTDGDMVTLIGEPDDPYPPKGVKFVKFQLERGKNGTPHYQGLLIYENAVRLATVKELLPRAHLEPMKSLKGSLAYVEKEDTRVEGPYEAGTPPKVQGARTDIKEVTDAILERETTVDEIALTNPTLYHQYGRTFQKVEDIALRRVFRKWMTEGIWVYGPTGTGKSHYAFEGFNPETHYLWKNDNGWQDGYTGQEIVIINDYRGHIPYDEMLQMVDKWPFTVRRRGREPAPFLAKKIIVTSALHPSEVYNKRAANDDIAQLLRRFEIKHFLTKSGSGV